MHVLQVPHDVITHHVAQCLDPYEAAVLLSHVCGAWRRRQPRAADFAQLFRDTMLGGGGGCRFQAANLWRLSRGSSLLCTMKKWVTDAVVGCHTSRTHALVFCDSGRIVCVNARWVNGQDGSMPGAMYYYVAGHVCLGQRLMSIELCDDGETMLCGFTRGIATINVKNVLQPFDMWYSNENGPLRGCASSSDGIEVYMWGARRGGIRAGLWRFHKGTFAHTCVALDVQCAVALPRGGVMFAQSRRITRREKDGRTRSCRLPFTPSSMQRAGAGRVLVRRQDGQQGGPSAVIELPGMRVTQVSPGPHTSVIGACNRVVNAPLRLYGHKADSAVVGATPGALNIELL